MAAYISSWLDGEPATAVTVPDRGLDFGDGLFETLLLQRGVPLYSEYHIERLQAGLQALSFPDCLSAVREQLHSAAASIAHYGWKYTALRVTVTRGAGPRGYAPPQHSQPRILIQATHLQQNCGVLQSPATLGVSAVRLSSQPLLAGIKHLNRLEQVLAASRAREQGVDEALMQDQNGHLVSVIAGNIFLLSGKELLTPVLIDAGVRGTRRRLVLEQWAPAIGLNLHEAVLTLADLETADEVFYSNSLTGLRPVATVNKRRWSSHEVCQQLFQQYREECP